METPTEVSKEPIVDNEPEPYPDDDEVPDDDDEDTDEDDDYPEEDIDKVRSRSTCILAQNSHFLHFIYLFIYFSQAPSSVKTPEKTEEEDTMPPYDVETQALIDG